MLFQAFYLIIYYICQVKYDPTFLHPIFYSKSVIVYVIPFSIIGKILKKIVPCQKIDHPLPWNHHSTEAMGSLQSRTDPSRKVIIFDETPLCLKNHGVESPIKLQYL